MFGGRFLVVFRLVLAGLVVASLIVPMQYFSRRGCVILFFVRCWLVLAETGGGGAGAEGATIFLFYRT